MPHLLYRALSFLLGALALSGACVLQALYLDQAVRPAWLIPPLVLGGLGGLLLSDRTLRNRSLHTALTQTKNRLEQLLAESENRYRHLFHLNEAVQLLIDPETGRIVEVNEAAQRFYGYSPSEFSRMTIMELNTDPKDTTREHMRRVVSMEQLHFRFNHRLHSGAVQPVAVYTVPVEVQGRTLLHSLIIDISEGNLAETNLRRKTLEQRLLVDTIPVCIWYLRDPETFGMVNKAYADRFGLNPSDIAHKGIREVLTRDSYQLALASNRQVFAEKKPLHYEQWLHFGQGEPRYMAISKTPKLGEQGQVDFVVCTGTDITRLQMAREMLRIERDLHIALAGTVSVEATLRICLDKALDVSQTDCGTIYLASQIGSGLSLAVHKGFSDSLLQTAVQLSAESPLARRLQNNLPCYAQAADPVLGDLRSGLAEEGVRAVGLVPIVHQERLIAALMIAARQMEHIPQFNRAVLERVATHIGAFLVQKEQSSLLRQHQQNFEALFNTIQDFVFIFDAEATIILCNAAAAERLGYRREELAGRNLAELHPPEYRQEVKNSINALLRGAKDHCPVPLVTRSGEQIPVETHITPGQWSGRPVLFGLSRDISARLQLEQQQRLLLKNEGLQRMAGAMAHHFNNLMTIVTGNLELAGEEIPPGSETRQLVNNALIGSKRASELGQALLIYTGQFAEKSRPINLSAYCRTELDEGRIALPAHIALTVDLIDPGPMVDADPGLLGQTLIALMTNARESIGSVPGRISLQVKTLVAPDLRKIHVFPTGWAPRHSRYGCLEITDTGTGIDAQRIASIFDPFYSEKFVGRGLGLPLALSIVKKLGGAITVESRLHQGSIFQVLLPESPTAAPGPQTAMA